MITVLSPQGDVRGTYENKVPNATPYFEDKLLDNLETEQTTLEFAVPLQSPDSEWLEGFSTVLYPDKDGVLRELTVINVWEDWNREEPLKRVVCEDSSVDILLKTHVVPFTAGSLEEAIRGALMASPWEYVIGEDTANIGYYLVDVKEYTDVRSVLETIKQTYGIEYRFSARFDGRKLTRVLNVAKRFGADTGKYFIYDRDLVNIERTIDYDNIHTSVITYWQEDDVMRTLAGYNPVNKIAGFRKDLSSDQIYHNEAHSQYDSDDYGKVLIMKSSSTDPELSYLEACNKLLDYIAPTYTYNVNVHILENALGFEGTEQIHLGDTVWLKEKVGDMELGLSARVIQLITSHTNPEEDEVTFTNFKEIDVADSAEVNALRNMIQQIQEQQDSITQTVVQVTENITQLQQGQEGIIVSLDGKSSISVGATPNPNPKNGDTWFTDVLDPATGKTYSTTKVWVETTQQWETKYSAKDAEEALEAANEAAQAGADAKAAADAAKVAADDAMAAGDEALAKVEQATVEINSAKDRINSIEIGVVDLTDNLAATDALANVAKDNAALAQTAANTAQTAAQEAKAAADNAQEAANTAGTNAQKAINDAQTAFDKAEENGGKIQEVVETVDGISTTVASVNTTADSALSKATTVETTVNGVKTTVAQVQEELEATDARVTTNETSIGGIKTSVSQVKTTADSALSKATTTETTVNGLKTTITSVETTANSALTKANTAQSTADGNKTTIASVKTTADSALTKATQVEQTADGLKTTITAVETTVNNLEVGARNYLPNSESPKFRSYQTSSVTYVENVSVPEWKATNAVRHTVSGGTGGIIAASLSVGRLVTAGVKYIHSIYIKNEGTTTVRLNNNLGETMDVAAGETKRVVFNPAGNAAGTATMQFVLYRLNAADVQQFVVWHAMIAEGTVVTDWVPSPDDLASVTKVTQIEATVDGLTTTVSQVKTTADSALSKATSVEQTANGLSTKITSVETTANSAVTKANTAQSTADGNKTAIASVKTTADSALSKATTTETTVNGLKTTVSSVESTANSALTKATSVEQTANGLTTTVATIQTDLNSTSSRNLLLKTSTLEARTVGTLDATSTLNGNATVKATWSSSYVDTYRQKTAVTPRDGQFTLTFWAKADRAVNFSCFFYSSGTTTLAVNSDGRTGTGSDGGNTLSATTTWKRFWIKYTQNGATAPKEVLIGRLSSAGTLWVNSPMLVEGALPEDWAPAPEDMATASQITQLSDQIDLRVTKNGVINAINVSTEGVVIAGSKVTITGDTTIANGIIKTAHIADAAISSAKIANLAVGTAQIGSAAITEAKIGNLAVTTAKIADLAVTNAKIGSLSANKITTGTLDAGVISVINLNASNIKSGTLSGLRIESPYDVPVASGATSNRRGSLIITDGYLRNVWQNYVVSSGSVTANGELTLNHEALTAVDRTGSSTTTYNTSMMLHAGGLTLQNYAGQGGTLSFQDLFSLGATSIPSRSGFEQYSTSPSSSNHPTAVRNGRLVQLKGSFRNLNLIDSGSEGLVMGLLPVGFRPLYSINFIVQGTGSNIYLLTVEPTGELKLGRYRGDTGSSNNYKFDYKEVSAGSWLNIACVFAAADV